MAQALLQPVPMNWVLDDEQHYPSCGRFLVAQHALAGRRGSPVLFYHFQSSPVGPAHTVANQQDRG